MIYGSGGTDEVNVGSVTAGVGMNDILGPLYVDNAGGWTDLTFNDSSDTSVSNNVRFNSNQNVSITGLAPATMSYNPSGIRTLAVLASNSTGGGGNKITVLGAPQNRINNLVINLSTGRNNDTVNVEGTSARLNINGENGQDTVSVGKAGKLDGIYGTVRVENSSGFTTLNIDNSADTSPKRLVVSSNAVAFGSKFIFFDQSDLKRLSVYSGPVATTSTVSSTPQNGSGTLETWLGFGAGDDTVSIRSTAGSLLKIDGGGGRNTVNVGNAGKLAGIQGDVLVFNSGSTGYADIKVDGSQDDFGRFAKIEADRVRDLSTGVIRFDPITLNSLVVSGSQFVNRFDILGTPQNRQNNATIVLNSGLSNDTVNVLRTSSHTTINGQNGSDLVSVGQAGNMQGISKPLVITNAGSYSTINLDDSNDAAGRAVTMDVIGTLDGVFGIVENLSPGTIWFKRGDLRALNIWSSSNLDFFLVKNTANSNIPGGSPTTIHAGQGADTIRVTGTTGALFVNPEGSNNLVNLGGDGAGSGSLTPLRGAVSVVGEGGDGNYLEIIDRASTGRYIYSMDGARVIRTPMAGTAPAVNLDVSEYSIVGMKFVGANTGNRYEIVGTKNTSASYPGGGFQMDTGDLNDIVNVTGSGSGPWNINMGGGSNQSITFGDATHSLDNIFSEVAVTGTGFINATVSDAASSIPCFARFDRVAGRQVLDLYRQTSVYTLVNTFQFQFGGTGRLNYQAGQVTEFGQYNQIDVVGLAANTEIVATGGPDKELFTAMLGTNVGAQAGPVTFNGSVQDSDQARYLEEFKRTFSQYSLQTNPLDASGLVVMSVGSPTVVFNGMTQLVHQMPRGGDNLTNIQSVPQNLFLVVVAGDGDAMTLGSGAPGQSGNIQNILGPVQVSGYTTDGEVTLTLDDSGNTTTAQCKHR